MFLAFIWVLIFVSFLILIHELGHFIAAKISGIKVEEFGFGYPPRIFGKEFRGTLYSLNAIPFGGFVKIAGMNKEEGKQVSGRASFERQSVWRKSFIILTGVLMNFLAGWLLFFAVFMIGLEPSLVVSDVLTDSPAHQAGMEKGDQILGISQGELVLEKPGTYETFTGFIQNAPEDDFVVSLKRFGKEKEIKLTSSLNKEGKKVLGIALAEAGVEAKPFGQSVKASLEQSVFTFRMIVFSFYYLFSHVFSQPEILNGILGPVGIVSLAARASSTGFVFLLQLMALISINLTVLNLIPFPALDGGHFILILFERIKGSPFSAKFERAVNGVGFVILLILMALITFKDIVSLF